jgi:hypothetical protein
VEVIDSVACWISNNGPIPIRDLIDDGRAEDDSENANIIANLLRRELSWLIDSTNRNILSILLTGC